MQQSGSRVVFNQFYILYFLPLSGYEIHGMEKIPDEGAALIVYYHGAIPIDYYYFLANVILQKGRTCHSVADHFVFKIPGMHGKFADTVIHYP